MLTQDSRIIVVGAGPAGLSTAFWLKQRGYTSVTVLEKKHQVGGMCKSLTVDGASFDLGANFVTKAYTNVRALAEAYDAPMYSEDPFYVMVAPAPEVGKPLEPVEYASLFDYVRGHDDGRTTNPLVFLAATMWFAWKRWWLSRLIDKPTFEGLAERPDLCVPFSEWLKNQWFGFRNLEYYLGRLFQVPVTMMGYGQLDQTPAPYVLKFMTLRTFIPMGLKALPWIGPSLTRWPKRFELGFQRLWERVSWDLDVRTGIDIHRIERPDGAPICVHFRRMGQDLNREASEPGVLHADAIVLACPLAADYLDMSRGGMLALSAAERDLFRKIHSLDYCMTTHRIQDLGGGLQASLGASTPLLAVFPETAETRGRPWAVAQAKSDVDFVQFYSRVSAAPDTPITRVHEEVQAGCDQLIEQMTLGSPAPPRLEAPDSSWHTFDRWNYFQHVDSDAFAASWYDLLGELQGQQRTYYVGGATNFELIEPITEFSKHLVEEHFPGDRIRFPRKPPQVLRWVGRAITVLGTILMSLILLFVLRILLIPPPASLYLEVPISHETPAAQAASEAYWDAFHGNDYSRVDEVIAGLQAAIDEHPDDQIVATLLGAAHLWKFQERRRVGGKAADYREHLLATRTWSSHVHELKDAPDAGESEEVFANAMHDIASWQLSRLDASPPLQADTITSMLGHAIEFPEFASFVMGWVVGAMAEPESPSFPYAKMGFDEMVDACAGFDVSDTMVYYDPVISVMAAVGYVSTIRRQCYNNPMAPHNLEAYFMSAGDLLTKAGELELAKLNYDNAARMPGVDTWPYKDELTYRQNADLAELQRIFLEQTPLQDIPPGQPAMTFRTGHGCSYCHAK